MIRIALILDNPVPVNMQRDSSALGELSESQVFRFTLSEVLADEVGVMACAHDRIVNIFAAMSRWGLRDAYIGNLKDFGNWFRP